MTDARTSSPKFREGDVVQHRDCGLMKLDREFEPGNWIITKDFSPERSLRGWHAVNFTLLRRPVRAGDVIRLKAAHRNCGVQWQIKRPSGDVLAVSADDCMHIGQITDDISPRSFCGVEWYAVEHADGTPIEPPAATDSKSKVPEASPPPAAKEEPSCDSCGNVGEMFAPTVCKHCLAAVEARLNDTEGSRDWALNNAVELQHEVDWLKRELRRLDPRLWKARYGR